ncbi:ABC transporter permease [Nocardioides bigeumensis]|uniref:ABC transporter permease n=1 Tax=Nocardioides bigeumensis TaxID=433657 RepID=A0ABP5JCL4_9ACTN
MTQEIEAGAATLSEAPTARRAGDLLRDIAANRFALAAAAFLVLMALLAFIGPLVLPLEPYKTNLSRLDEGPSWDHLLGTDQSGRDTFARCILGARTSLIVGFSAVAIYLVIGTLLGSLAGYLGGVVDMIVSRTVDALLSIPLLLLVTVFIAFLKPGVLTVILVIGLLGWPPTARITRAATMSLRESDFIIAARVSGLTKNRIMRGHVLPNLAAPLIVVASLGIGTAILLEAALGFLGLGVRPPTPSLGVMVTEAKDPVILRNSPWIWMPPAVLLALLVMAVNVVGDALRDVLSPRQGGTAGL